MIAIALLVLGLVLLIAGAEGLVRGAVGLAQRLKVSPAVVGVTVVAWGTSMPELVVSVGAALTGRADVAMGNVVGSNVYNIALILGLSAIIRPLTMDPSAIRRDLPILGLSAGALWLACLDGTVSRVEGVVLLFAMAGYTLALLRAPSDDEGTEPGPEVTLAPAAVLCVGGAVLLALGADLFVDNAVVLASQLGLSERVIGLTIVALGTSLPELVTSLVAATKGQSDIAIANVIGSNVFNVLAVLGTAAAIAPVTTSPNLLDVDVPVLFGLTAVLMSLLVARRGLTRLSGVGLFALGAAYTGFLLL